MASGLPLLLSAGSCLKRPTANPDVIVVRALLDEAGHPDPDGDGPCPRLQLTPAIPGFLFLKDVARLAPPVD